MLPRLAQPTPPAAQSSSEGARPSEASAAGAVAIPPLAPDLRPLSERVYVDALPEKEVVRKGGRLGGTPRQEDHFNVEELRVLRQVKAWMSDRPGRFEAVPYDLLACFVRAYAPLVNWADTVHARLDACIDWREEARVGEILDDEAFLTSDQRVLFETAFPCGPIGRTSDGFLVILETPGASNALMASMMNGMTFESFLRSQVYNKECLRRYLTSICMQEGRRQYMSVVVVDLAGLGSTHFKSKTLDWFKRYTAVFQNFYPETMLRTYVINAPMIFTGLWKAIRIFLHPTTAAKISVSSWGHEKIFHRDGIQLFGSTHTDSMVPWREVVRRLDAGHDRQTLAAGYLPSKDATALQELHITDAMDV